MNAEENEEDPVSRVNKQASTSNLPLTVIELTDKFSDSSPSQHEQGNNSRGTHSRALVKSKACTSKLVRSCSLVNPRYTHYPERSPAQIRGLSTVTQQKVAIRTARSFSCSSKDSFVIPDPRKMAFVPSPGMNHYSNSPYSSIYEQDKTDVWTAVCRGSNSNMDYNINDDMAVLDDKLEDSTLQNFLTSDVMHSLQNSIPVSSEFQWVSKPGSTIPANTSSDSLGSNPTLTQLNMEPDMSIVEDILNMDSADENSTFVDFLCSAANSPFNSFASVSSEPVSLSKNFVTTSANPQSQVTAKVIHANGSVESRSKLTDPLNASFSRNSRENFPPRGTQQPPVGVVAPVIQMAKVKETEENLKKDRELNELCLQTPKLHNLLKNVQKPTKPESIQCYPVTVAPKEMPAQRVPLSSNSVVKSSMIKSEPLSPEKGCRKREPGEEESTEAVWKDIENFIHNPDTEPTTKKRRRNNSGSSAYMSDEEEDDEDDKSIFGVKDYDDDSDDDYSDIDADLTRITPSECESLVASGKKQKQFFWQYNVQSKGPKGTRLKLAVDASADPHVLNDFEDPVFDESNTLVAGIRHGGKARKGDGNEITPNPKKLFMIGHQLLRLNRQINAFQLGPDVPLAKRNASKKEKNKLASRACRLKKKAQHEANKVKLYGLEKEHSQLNKVLQYIKPFLFERARALMGQSNKMASGSEFLSEKLEKHTKDVLATNIAGHTVDYVNNVILQVEAGDNSGGLKVMKRQKT